MSLRKNILDLITEYFGFSLSVLETERFYKSQNLSGRNQLFPIESNNSFDLYEIVLPYQYYLIDYNIEYSSSLFLTPQAHAFINMTNSTESLSHLHRHNFFEYIYILDGELDFVIESTHHRYFPGQCCIINPRCV